ncbi:MAG: hypothetical protein M3328_06240, partial [Chloroflexota bacterium]|nr:hypothetical protein [Chloroflexota bacterium]
SLLCLGVVALVAVELAPMPYPQRPADIPLWYHQLGQEPGDFSILELPEQDDYWHGAYRMYFQTAHGKRIFGGYISREFPHPFLRSTPGYQELMYADGAGDMFKSGPDVWFSALAQYKTRYIVLQKDRLPDKDEPPVDVTASREAVSRLLAGAAPSYSDEQLEAYRVPPPEHTVPFLSVGEGWQPRELGPNGAFRWMGDRATLRVDAPRSEQAYLVFRATAIEPRTMQVFHGGTRVLEQQIGGLQEFKVGPLGVPAGVSTITFVSPEGSVSPKQLGMGNDPRHLSFSVLEARLEPVSK